MDANFTCEHCGKDVPWGQDKTPRDHCPSCLWSKHVSLGAEAGYPPCGALMRGVPVGDGNELVTRCLGCGFSYRHYTDDYTFAALTSGLVKNLRATLYGKPQVLPAGRAQVASARR